MNNFWNEKYNKTEYLYGIEPNEYLKLSLTELEPGKILFPAEGEGRNAVWAAANGWDVTAFDPSTIGRQKALKLASQKNTIIDYQLKGYEQVFFADDSFDVIALTYTHMPPDLRKIMHTKYLNWLKPNGSLFLEAFSKEQLQYNSGGPKDIAMLFSEDELKSDFKSAAKLHIKTQTISLNEGEGHMGDASVIRLHLKK